ncbi:hypothetical protein SSOG_00035 [Streptomyces himastatinicus ATCC 53653]|uniref:Mandelate racemase/muconate lactonizing enzyme family protein n=1 Tax=Streptomyces himastatinicus ATCC 53653 TaxID=457427 RepID=D9W5W7_9ACTN|nr:hypothetical protein [Streptomyces himastatinicus]EFL20323.1 hypothetical protein SSOG_00035 [Streptomyces himastatinicus ATCC 53653]
MGEGEAGLDEFLGRRNRCQVGLRESGAVTGWGPWRQAPDGLLKYRQQITDQQVKVVDGHITVPEGPGLGFAVDETELRRLGARAQS